MRITIFSFLIGVLFGLGLLIAGMLDPAKVQGFLNITGNWDPSLAFVMVGGIGVSLVGLKLAGNMAKPVLAELFVQPVSQPRRNSIESFCAITLRLASTSELRNLQFGENR